jgi:hypothetical protein
MYKRVTHLNLHDTVKIRFFKQPQIKNQQNKSHKS